MLRKGIRYSITAVVSMSNEIINIVESSLFNTLEQIHEELRKEKKEWCLECYGIKSKINKAYNNIIIGWYFISSEETYNEIVKKFNQSEDMNWVTFYITEEP